MVDLIKPHSYFLAHNRGEVCSELIHKQAELLIANSELSQRCTLTESLRTALFQRCAFLKTLYLRAKKNTALKDAISQLILAESLVIQRKIAPEHTFLELDSVIVSEVEVIRTEFILIRIPEFREKQLFRAQTLSVAEKKERTLKVGIKKL